MTTTERRKLAYWNFVAVFAFVLLINPPASAGVITSIGGFIGDQFDGFIRFAENAL